MRRCVAAFVIAGLATLALALPAPAQDAPTTTSTAVEVPAPDIIPRPDSGHAPTEAGDRGGALQLGLLALVVVVLGGGVALVVHQSRAARRSDR